MRTWAWLTVMLYLAAMVLLTAPLLWIAFGGWGSGGGIGWPEAVAGYRAWGYWVWLGFLGLGQALLLFVPVRIANRRPTSRRSLLVPVLVSGFFMSNLLTAMLVSLLCVFRADRAFDFFGIFGEVTLARPIHAFVTKRLLHNPEAIGVTTFDYIFGMMLVMTLVWGTWALLFYVFRRVDDPNAVVKRTTHWLLRGSILELLIAIPSHIIVRNRNDCCAPLGTVWGITTGLSVMLLCFGPGVFFLFAARMDRRRNNVSSDPGPATN